MITGNFPSLRLRRSRKNDWSRRLIQENSLSASDFILPIFLIDGNNSKQTIKTMPDVYRYTVDKLGMIVDKAIKNQINQVKKFQEMFQLMKLLIQSLYLTMKTHTLKKYLMCFLLNINWVE